MNDIKKWEKIMEERGGGEKDERDMTHLTQHEKGAKTSR